MKEIKLYLSENEQFVFETKEECDHYNSFGEVKFTNPFLVIEDVKFSILEININEKTRIIQAILQSLTVYGSELCYSNHNDLWRVTYDFNTKHGSFEKKSGTYDSVYCDLDHESANAEGWFPFWDYVHMDCYTVHPEVFSKEAFMLWIHTCLVNYFTAFGHIEHFQQEDVETPADIRGLYGFLAIKKSKYLRRIDELRKKKESLKELQDKSDICRNYQDIDILLNRTSGFVKFIEEIENFL